MTETPGQDNIAATSLPSNLWRQWWSALSFLTRLPCPATPPVPLGSAAWAFPAVGFVVGALGAAAMAIALALGIGALASAAIAVAFIVYLTGALHEDGLADCADAFGLPRTVERTREILKDPRMGAFGVVALCLALLLRVALAAEAGPLALLAAEMLSRSAMAAAMVWSQPSGQGLAQAAGKVSAAAAIISGALALGLALALAGPAMLWGTGIAAIAGAMLLNTSRRRLGGSTGDVLGAVQQLSLLALLASACVSP